MDKITVIGQSIFISGNIEGDEDLSVQGRIEGNITLKNTLFLEETGVIKADVSVKNAVISGVLVGNLEAKESIEISEIGIVVGDIIAPRIVIREGAKFKGNVNMSSYDDRQNAPKLESPKTKSLSDKKSSFSKRPFLKKSSDSKKIRRGRTRLDSPKKVKTPAVNDKVEENEAKSINNAVKDTIKKSDKNTKRKDSTPQE